MNNFIRMFYMALFIIAPILTNKILAIGPMTIPAGQFFVMLLMLGFVDVMNQREGIKEARQMILNAVIAKSIIYLVIIPLAIVLPAAPFWHGQQVFQGFLHESIRYFLASELIHFVGQYIIDTKVFASIKNKNWFVRSLGSDLVSTIIQTTGFILLSFWGTGKPILLLIVSNIIFSMILSLGKTIIMYPLTIKKK